jgi:imidazoleglycerol phosphate dehydratase HisB
LVEGTSPAARGSIAKAARNARARPLKQASAMLHVEVLYGTNDHHIAEACFKGLARALRAAFAIDPRAAGEVPSTKGTLGN